MNIRTLAGPLIAIVILMVIALQTNDALHRSGTWGVRHTGIGPAPDPYARLEAQLSTPDAGPPTDMRDPFSYGRSPVAIVHSAPVVHAPPPPALPQLTAILTGEEARALVRYRDHDYSVRVGEEFAEFKVISISADQVVLDRGGQRVILQRPTRGEP